MNEPITLPDMPDNLTLEEQKAWRGHEFEIARHAIALRRMKRDAGTPPQQDKEKQDDDRCF